ncbi:MAG: indole-3-glycerol phosphate synthase TrpC [Armatimonadota bacterium]|nr:indole-3-glycerol phosphate synthase TrpC [Armatimonadota bacterium]MDW8156449.1 indole-3-glycerol phosphate synthase TrpC [Armatimonadota bacterium]
MSVLDQIVAHKQAELAEQRRRVPEEQLALQTASAPAPRPFAEALRGPGLRVVAEVKAASPSAGVLREDLDPAALARAYAGGGACALSVVTDRRFFRGSSEHLQAAREATHLPVLRKDFALESYHVYEARALGADAVLLIAAVLDRRRLAELVALTEQLGMAAVVEVHTEAEVDRALEAGARVVGINNRDLRTFQVDLGVTERLRPRIPDPVVVVSESGIETPAHVRRVWAAGARAVLVGSALVRSPDPARKLQELVGAVQAEGGTVSWSR